MAAFVAEAGATVGDRYRLDRLVGEGGMGVVWAATHLVTRKPVALKFLKAAAWTRSEVRRRLVREARATSVIQHPNVLQTHDVLELPDGAPVLVMDLLDGEPLSARLARRGPLPLAELAWILGPVVSAVGTGHAHGIIHRDLKPDNIFLVRLPDGGEDVRVLDFGIAKLTATSGDAARSGDLTRTGDMLGTPFYMAPEQTFGEELDARADVWALGVVMYECLSGTKPFTGENFGQIFKRIALGDARPIAELVPGLPGDLCDLVGRMLSRDRDGRPSDLREVRELLGRYTDERSRGFGSARPDPAGREGEGIGRLRRGARLALAAGLALALLGGLAGWFLLRGATTHEPIPAAAAPVAPIAPSPAVPEPGPASAPAPSVAPPAVPVEGARAPAPAHIDEPRPVRPANRPPRRPPRPKSSGEGLDFE